MPVGESTSVLAHCQTAVSDATLDLVFVQDVGIRIDREGDVPVGVQLAWALRGAIASGTLRAGDRLPPLRELAIEVGVNANTLRTAYAKLEADGLDRDSPRQRHVRDRRGRAPRPLAPRRRRVTRSS